MPSMEPFELVEESENIRSPSERTYQQIPYDAIMDVAPIGALIFLITDTGQLSNDVFARRIYRRWQGLERGDTTNWHTTIYDGPQKESKGGRHRPYIIHASSRGTTRDLLPREYFKNTREGHTLKRNRIEILANPDFSEVEYGTVIDFCRSQIGKPFDGDPGWKREWVTLLLGIRSRRRKPEEISCHGLAFDAYRAAGMEFPHQLESAPNLMGRIWGHPIGHPSDHVDLNHLYLRDHHLYRDPRLLALLAVAGEGTEIRDVIIQRNPCKYSWDEQLQRAYGLRGD